METGCSSNNATLNGSVNLGPAAGHNGLVAPIFQLPTELVIKIFQSVLPSTDVPIGLEARLLSYMRTLYKVRLIGKRSQEIIDETPAFWKFVIYSVPPHVNEATLARSKNGPLTVIYPYSEVYHGRPRARVSAENFLGSFAHTFPRWSAYSGPLVSGYFHTPAPHLRTIVLWPLPDAASNGALDLLGGSVNHLRHVDLSYVPVRWRAGLGFAQLKVLKLIQASEGEFLLTTTHVLDALRASPCLEHLELRYMRGSIDHDHPPSSPVITYLRLRCIIISRCGHRFAGAVLRRIQAPSCTELHVDELPTHVELDHPQATFLDEDLQNFKDLLRAIHSQNGFSKITLENATFGWNSFAGDVVEGLPTFSVWLGCPGHLPFIERVEDILQDSPATSIRLSLCTRVTQEVLERTMSMRCVTRLEILRSLWNHDWSLLTLKFIGEPLSTDPSLPPLPFLQELLLTGAEWPLQSVLDMVRSRFNPSLWQSTEWTPLTIKIPRGAPFTSTFPRVIFDLTTLTRIRDTDGVECVQFLGSEELDGTLAVTWDEENSTPAWD